MEMINFVPGVKDNESGTATIIIDLAELKLLSTHLTSLISATEREIMLRSDLCNIINYIDENYKF